MPQRQYYNQKLKILQLWRSLNFLKQWLLQLDKMFIQLAYAIFRLKISRESKMLNYKIQLISNTNKVESK